MITLNDIRRFYEEKDFDYDDQDTYLRIRHYTLGDEEVPAEVIIDCDDDFFTVDCFLPQLFRLELNERVYNTLSDLNKNFRFFQITLSAVKGKEGKYRLNLEYSTPAQYIANPGIAGEMLVTALKIMDKAYLEILRARFSN